MLDAMGAEPDRILHCIRVGGLRHDLEAALPADLESSADLVIEQERMGVEVPSRPHDGAREVKLDMVDAVLDLLAHRRRCPPPWQDGGDAAILHQHGTIRPYLGLDAVDQAARERTVFMAAHSG